MPFSFLIYLCVPVLIVLVGLFVGPILNCIVSLKNLKPPADLKCDEWKSIVIGSSKESKSGIWIGRLESLIFYFTFLQFKKSSALVIGGWLAFKVASKWETWGNIHKVPDFLSGISNIEYFKARRAWGNAVYERFLIGTLFNILIGYFAYKIAQLLINREDVMFIWLSDNWITIICTLLGALVSIFSTKYYYQKSINRYKSVINKNFLERTKSNWGHYNEINNIAATLQSSTEKNIIVGHSANGLTDAGYIDGVMKNLVD